MQKIKARFSCLLQHPAWKVCITEYINHSLSLHTSVRDEFKEVQCCFILHRKMCRYQS